MRDKRIDSYLGQIDTLKKDKEPRRKQMLELAEYLAPYRSVTTEEEDNYSEYSQDVFETRPIDAKRKMRDGLYGYTCSPQSAWFEHDGAGLKHADRAKVKEVDRVLYTLLNQNSFYKQAHMFVDDGVTFGTAAMLTRRRGNRVNYKTINPFRFVFDQDEDGNLLTFAYEYFMTAAQAASILRAVGKEIPKRVVEAAEVGEEKPFRFYYMVIERETAAMWKEVRTKMQMPFAEILLMEGEDNIIYEGGFNSDPVSLWKFYETSGNRWGFGPGDDVIPDVKYVNRIAEYYLDGVELRAVPPMMAPLELKANDFLYAPKEVYWTMNTEIQPAFMSPGGDLVSTENAIIRKTETINYAYMVDFWTMLSRSTKRKTAYEVSAEESEKLALIASPVQSLIDSLKVVLERTREIAADLRLIDTSVTAEFKFNGMLAQAQRRMAEGNGTMRAMQEISPFLLGPEQMDVVNIDEFIRLRMEINNADPRSYRTSDETDKIRKQRAEAMAKQEQDAKTIEAAKASSDGAEFSQIAKGIGAVL